MEDHRERKEQQRIVERRLCKHGVEPRHTGVPSAITDASIPGTAAGNACGPRWPLVCLPRLSQPSADATLGSAAGRSAEELALLLRLHRAVSGQRDREAVLAAARQAVEGLLPAARWVLAIPGAPGSGDLAGGFAAGSLLGWVIEHRRPAVVSSLDEIRDTFPSTHDALRAEQMQSLLALPLESQARCIGALALLARGAHAWDRRSESLFDEIARTLAAALDNCLEFERVAGMSGELAALLDVNQAIGRHLGRDELFGALAKCLREVVPTDRFGIELPIEGDRLQGHLLTPRGSAAEPTRPTVLPAPGTACHWVLVNREWLISASREELRERFPVTFEVMQQESMESLCALPLVTAQRARGVLFFMAGRPGAYSSLRRGLLEQVASAVAVALDDCLAHEEVATLRDRLAAENVYLQEEIAQEHNFNEIVGRSAAEPTRPTVLPAPGTACIWVLVNREWLISATRDELRERFPVTFDVMQQESMESLCALPLVTAQRARGVLFFMAARPGAYASLRRGLLEQIASAVAGALDDCLAH